jgi:hypothetical protein
MTHRSVITLCFVMIFFQVNNLYSQEKKKLPIPGLYNTGVDNNKQPLGDGETDPHYILSISADVDFPGPDSRVVYSAGFPMGAWITNDNYSKWIAPRADASEFNSQGMYIYTLYFSLTGFKPETAEIKGFWMTDNNGADILINNYSTGNMTFYNSFAFGLTPFEIKHGFKEGMNSISFAVYNGEAPTGLRVVISGEAEPLEFAEE